MAKKYLDENGLLYFWQKIKTYLATPTRAGLMSPTDKAKVDAITNEGTIAYYKKLEGSYTTTTEGESTIAIPIASYSTADILLVDINGLDLVAGTDYTVSGTNIVLTTPISMTGQTVHFVALRATTATASDYDTLKGEDGKGIVSVEKTGTSGLVDTYTISYTDGTTSTFIVTNGEDGGGSAPYLTSETASGTTAKTTTLVSGNLPATLETGQQVIVKFTNYNSASSPTLTVGSYGAIAIKRYGTTAPSTSQNTSWKNGSVIVFIYDGTYWQMADWTNENTTYSSMSQSEMYAGTATTGRLITAARLKEAIEYFDAQGSNLADYVVEQGTDGIWTYRKWNSGLYDAWYVGNINLLSGSAWLNGAYYHKASSTLLPPSFSTSVTDLVGACNSAVLCMYAGHNANYETYWVNGASGALNDVHVRLDMHGRWK